MSEQREAARLRRERRTMEGMVRLYCQGVHERVPTECAECGELLEYARRRIERCPFHEEKPPCAHCPIHCYEAKRRQQIKMVMRYAGPRMVLRHPLFALRHWVDGFRKAPDQVRGKNRRTGS